MEKDNISILALFSVVIAIGFFLFGSGMANKKLGGSNLNMLSTFTHSTTSIAATGKNTVLENNARRKYAIIRNTSSTAICYLTFADTTSTSAGYYLVNDEYIIDDSNFYMGKITGICSPAMTLQLMEAY